MKNFHDYLTLAINRHGLRGNNALAREIGINSAAMSALYNGKSLPAESTMIKLAELAGLPKEEALIDLNLWRSERQPEIQNVWLRLSKMIKVSPAFLAAFLSSGKVNAAGFECLENSSDFNEISIYLAVFCLLLFSRQIIDYATNDPVLFFALLFVFAAVFVAILITKNGGKHGRLKQTYC